MIRKHFPKSSSQTAADIYSQTHSSGPAGMEGWKKERREDAGVSECDMKAWVLVGLISVSGPPATILTVGLKPEPFSSSHRTILFTSVVWFLFFRQVGLSCCAVACHDGVKRSPRLHSTHVRWGKPGFNQLCDSKSNHSPPKKTTLFYWNTSLILWKCTHMSCVLPEILRKAKRPEMDQVI